MLAPLTVTIFEYVLNTIVTSEFFSVVTDWALFWENESPRAVAASLSDISFLALALMIFIVLLVPLTFSIY